MLNWTKADQDERERIAGASCEMHQAHERLESLHVELAAAKVRCDESIIAFHAVMAQQQ